MNKNTCFDENTIQKKCSNNLNKSLVLYELRNIAGNPMLHIFGILLPIFLSVIITKAAAAEIPAGTRDYALKEAAASISITMSLLIPMATILIGHSAVYSQEMEKGIPQRMSLFGFKEKTLFWAKGIAEFINMTIAIIIYAVAEKVLLDIQTPKASSAICLLICLYLTAIILYMLSTGIVNFVRKFGPSYAICMTLYFIFMLLGGMMGIKTEQLPKVLKIISKLLPISYISNDFGEFWRGGRYNFVPMIQAFLFFGAISGIVFYLSQYKKKRG
ncbi:MAG: ABC transporter permease [Lachnospiraceae bacterium]|nr:ABC transporter permease [Lachnospiraceae bacterium]